MIISANFSLQINFCLSVLLKLELKIPSLEAEQKLLKPLNLMPYKFRLFFRFSLLAHKILNKQILLNISDLLQPFTKLTHTRENNSNLFLTLLSVQIKLLNEFNRSGTYGLQGSKKFIPENPVFSLRYDDRILFFYLVFVPDTICFLKLNFLRNLIPGTNYEKVLLYHQSLK